MPSTGAWVAFDSEGSAALFSSEIQAFRFANGKPMRVAAWPFGRTLEEVIAAADEGDADER